MKLFIMEFHGVVECKQPADAFFVKLLDDGGREKGWFSRTTSTPGCYRAADENVVDLVSMANSELHSPKEHWCLHKFRWLFFLSSLPRASWGRGQRIGFDEMSPSPCSIFPDNPLRGGGEETRNASQALP